MGANYSMDEFIKELDSNYILDSYRIKENVVIFQIQSNAQEVECPYCGTKSRRMHSTYVREVQDLPTMGKKTILLVKSRKMFCDNQECAKRTFSERHKFVVPSGKKTIRLEKNILYTATNVSSVNASKVLKAGNISVSKSSICEMLKKNACCCG